MKAADRGTRRRALLSEIRMDDIIHDGWGTAMGWWFSIAGELARRGDGPPDHWEYRPGAMGIPDPEPDSYSDEVVASYPSATLIEVGNLLERYTRALEHAGRSY